METGKYREIAIPEYYGPVFTTLPLDVIRLKSLSVLQAFYGLWRETCIFPFIHFISQG